MALAPDLNSEEIFDDSSFYGSDDETTALEEEAAEYDPHHYWTHIHPKLLSTIQARNQEEKKQLDAEKSKSDEKMSYTPMDIDTDTEGTVSQGPLPRNKPGEHESSTDFLKRLPPSTTKASSHGPWIYIHTENLAGHKEDIPEFTRKGLEALHAFDEKEASLRYENDRKKGSAIALSRKVKPLQRELETHVFSLARETNCVTGKWMMFITADRVDAYWGAVAEATMAGTLGIGAKVATDVEEDKRARLIAIYTRDYDDKDDVKRVLRKLVELNLVRSGKKPIFYKRDALTYLDIMSGNKYGIKPSAFSSADILGGNV
ncbi:DUF1917 domain-containing protein [Aspergillus undulatus]|uniref:DUF1917 domain-containing protein n=1 Tax=Aspergillus undulatus TaxID=1810928 RepID=UPI003CCD32D7